MTEEELRKKLESLIKGLPSSELDAVADGVVGEIETYAATAGTLGWKNGKQLLENLAAALSTRKSGGNTDDSVLVRIIALDFFIKKMQSGDTEDL